MLEIIKSVCKNKASFVEPMTKSGEYKIHFDSPSIGACLLSNLVLEIRVKTQVYIGRFTNNIEVDITYDDIGDNIRGCYLLKSSAWNLDEIESIYEVISDCVSKYYKNRESSQERILRNL